MKNLALILFVFISYLAQAQDYSDPQNIKVVRSQEAHFAKGEEALYNYFFECIVYSDESIQNEVDSEVMLSFAVEKDSTLSNVKVITGPGFGVNEAVKNCLLKIKYAPALENGVKMRSQQMLTVPVRAYKKR